ncbi:hypothetical protein M406DRAFT_332650 [Cryphonectria parasitica EP155]|uniref:Uncharacterized protein n=1 Tax=Cryphonectria parasitica (strain ATCC 38755 / EP155) TaxID=660469 RepID=A0A9P4XWU8_CRYP1|nr:uncharacterized protein M406DRAFT_332650 [Cryphonectria parasitica EP155]KAF3762267.1 hypothetical protein M406DRAFT_332650 [Cryphonectria parasitica EP155]
MGKWGFGSGPVQYGVYSILAPPQVPTKATKVEPNRTPLPVLGRPGDKEWPGKGGKQKQLNSTPVSSEGSTHSRHALAGSGGRAGGEEQEAGYDVGCCWTKDGC